MGDQYLKTSVPSHGYVAAVKGGIWGSDELIIEAARMSTAKGFLGWGTYTCDHGQPGRSGDSYATPGPCEACGRPTTYNPGDEKLLRHLWTNRHYTPFEMAGAQLEVKAPIFVFREWHRHRTQSYNEMSARYVPLPDENYIPAIEDLVARSKAAAETKNRQAQAHVSAVLTLDEALADVVLLQEHYASTQRLYERFLSRGWPKELARIHLPVARYSVMRAQASLRCWLMFLDLRDDKNAQKEIRMFAKGVGAILSLIFPRTMQLFYEGRAQ